MNYRNDLSLLANGPSGIYAAVWLELLGPRCGCWPRILEMAARLCLGIFRYLWYANDSHRPRIFIVESSTLLATAVVAAPMRKLWPAN